MITDILLIPNTIPAIYWMFALSILLVIVDTFTKKESNLSMGLALLGLSLIIVQSFITIATPASTNISDSNLIILGNFAKEMLNFNAISSIFDVLFCFAGILTIIISKEYLEKVYYNHKEYYSLLAFSIFGMMCICHSNNLIVLFLGIETMSITFYALTGFLRKRESAVEGALKYFLLGSFASAFLLYGIAMLYGATSSMNYIEIGQALASNTSIPLYLKLGLGLFTIGLLFKVAAFPFHQWAPDVYQAAGTPVSGFMQVAGKIAALSGFVGLFSVVLSQCDIDLKTDIAFIIAIVAALTMLVGNITAVKQTNVKRMLSYSSVGHAGYMLIGIVVNNAAGINAIIYYSLAYTLTQIGAFAIISIIETKEEKQLLNSDYQGLSKSYPFLCATFAMFLFSLAGIPPFAGFMGKYFLFKAAIDGGFIWLTVIAVITSIIACYFYLSIIIQMYFKESVKEILVGKYAASKITVLVSAIGIIVVSLFPLMDYLQGFHLDNLAALLR